MPQSAYPTATVAYAGSSVVGQSAHLAGDQLRLVVQQRRQRVDVDRPAARGRRSAAAGWASAPQAIRAVRARTGQPANAELVDEPVVEVGAVGELDIGHLLQQRRGAGALAQREQGHLRALAGDVAGGDDAQHRQLRHQPDPDGGGGGEVAAERPGQQHLLDVARARGRAPRAAATSRWRSRPWRTGARGRRAGRGTTQSAGSASGVGPVQHEHPLLADLGEPVGERRAPSRRPARRARSGRRRRAGRPGPARRPRRPGPEPHRPARLDVADDAELDGRRVELHDLDRAVGGAHPAADRAALEGRARRARRWRGSGRRR